MRSTDDGLSFITVVFEREVPLLALQAKSIAKFVDRSLVKGITIVLNGRNNEKLKNMVERIVATKYGELRSRVEVVEASAVYPEELPDSGWHAQQILKIYAAKKKEGWVCVLDAKNHFIKPIARADFFAADGRALAFMVDNTAMSPQYANSMYIIDVDEPPSIADSFATYTPAILCTDLVRELVAVLGGIEGGVTASVCGPRSGTEFFLYYAYLLKSGAFDRLYMRADGKLVQTIWKGDVAIKIALRRRLREAVSGEAKVLSVHRLAFAEMFPGRLHMIYSAWKEIGLIRHSYEGLAYTAFPGVRSMIRKVTALMRL